MKKLILAFGLFLLLSTPAFARTCTWDGGGGDNLASTAANWDTDTTCVAADAVVFDGTSAKNCTFDLTASFASINTTGYGGVVTASATITVTGGVTFANSTFTHGSQKVIIAGTQTINTGTAGNTFYNLESNGSYTYTLSNDVTVTHELLIGNGTDVTWNGAGKNLIIQGDVNTAGNLINFASGTAGILINGSASQTLDLNTYSPGSRGIGNAFTINKTGGTATFKHSTTTSASLKGIWFKAGFTYTAGTCDFSTNSVLVGFHGTQTISANSLTFYDVALGSDSVTYTLSNPMYVANTFYIGQSLSDLTINGSTVYLQKNLSSVGNYNRSLSGTTTFEWTGSTSGNWTPEANTTGTRFSMKVPMVFNKSGGTLTIDDWVKFGTGGSITYTAGTVSVGTTKLEIGGNVTMNTGSGVSWYNVTWTATNTTTLSSVLTVTNTLQSSGATTLSGTGGISAKDITIDSTKSIAAGGNTVTLTGNWTNSGTFTANTSNVTFNGTSTASGATAFYSLTVNSGKTLHLTSTQTFSTNASGTFTASGCTIDATTPSSSAILTVSGSQSVGTVTATDIDSSLGNTVHNIGGSNTRTTNWDTSAPAARRLILVVA